ncbi:UDP pyrophosphate synthetase [Salmonella enterica subsp. enterica]|uniref:UDP pyrophosphate synthetase n=1 Tax=Salmonella enterica I TaxID=59201 RepID=A0A447MXR1_SALET|nr:UDP pyrophosphate synthetase [Salmonella enterica subsp. enterica]
MDLVIRTGGEHRISNFCFGKLPMPNFTLRMFFGPISMNKTLKVRLHAFANRERRFGGTEPGDDKA